MKKKNDSQSTSHLSRERGERLALKKYIDFSFLAQCPPQDRRRRRRRRRRRQQIRREKLKKQIKLKSIHAMLLKSHLMLSCPNL